MAKKSKKLNSGNKVIPVLKTAINVLLTHRYVIVPYAIIACVQLLLLEILYFFPRYPLNVFFGPIISKIWSEEFLHYPLNFVLLPKLFQYAQIPVYILFSSFFIAIAISIIAHINDGKKVNIRQIANEALPKYIYVVMAAIIIFSFILLSYKLYGIAYDRALEIRSKSGIFYLIKSTVINGVPYFSLVLSAIVTTIFAYVVPVIICEDKKIFQAIWENFKMLFKNCWITFLIVAIPSLFYLPVLILRNSISVGNFVPEFRMFVIVVSIFIMVGIDAVIYTALTTFYLLKKES